MVLQPRDTPMRNDATSHILFHDRFPRSNNYDPDWVMDNQMGPNVLWLTEALTNQLNIDSSMRVLDLGAGRALSSIFLASEFGCQVWAADLWIDASENWTRITKAGLSNRVFPLNAEAHDLPFADGFFDAIVSLDAYHYFGTDDSYLEYILRFLRPKGSIGIVVPAVFTEFGPDVPDHLIPFRGAPFHGAGWWRSHWEKSGLVEEVKADHLPEGWADWLRWNEVTLPALTQDWAKEAASTEIELLRVDKGEQVGFARVIARRR